MFILEWLLDLLFEGQDSIPAHVCPQMDEPRLDQDQSAFWWRLRYIVSALCVAGFVLQRWLATPI